MLKYPWPDWMKSSFDQRFNELAKIACGMEEIKALHQKQTELEMRLKQVLDAELFRIILDWEDVMNFRNAVEKEDMYIAGIKDGLSLYRQLLDFKSADADKT
jgi:hypothetical protein